MDRLAEGVGTVDGPDVLDPRRLEHLRRVVHHVLAHVALVVANLTIEREHGEAPFIRRRAVEPNTIVVIRERLAEAGQRRVRTGRQLHVDRGHRDVWRRGEVGRGDAVFDVGVADQDHAHAAAFEHQVEVREGGAAV